MSKDLDEEILDKANEWQREEQETRRERERTKREKLRLRHERWVAVGRFFKWALIICILLGGIGTGIWGGVRCHAGCQAENLRKAEQWKRLDLLYEQAWMDCVKALGREQCRVVQETWLYRCSGPLGNATSVKLMECAEQRLAERIRNLEEGTQ